MTKLDSLRVDSLKDIGSRIRWKSVLAVVFLLVVVVLVFRNFPAGYVVKDEIGLDAYAEPDVIRPDGRTVIRVEVKNMAQEGENMPALVEAKAYNENLVFTNTSGTSVEAMVKIGPKESRRLSFDMAILPGALEGTYRVDVTARLEGRIEGAVKPVYIRVGG